jgi:hypothetical protein
MKRSLGAIAVAAATAVLLVAPGAADATVTMGSNLLHQPDSSIATAGGTVTAVPLLATQERATYKLFSLVTGTVVLWRIRTGPTDTGPVAFRVLRQAGQGLTGAGTSPTVTPALGAVSAYRVSMPIRAGDTFGLDCCADGTGQFFQDTTFHGLGSFAETEPYSNPPLTDGGPARTISGYASIVELMVNADIEPASAYTPSVRAVSGGKVSIDATLPNPGALIAGDARDPLVIAATGSQRKGKKAKPLLQPLRTEYKTFAFGQNQFPASFRLHPTQAAKKKLKAGKRIKVNVLLAYTPLGGGGATRSIRVRLKP